MRYRCFYLFGSFLALMLWNFFLCQLMANFRVIWVKVVAPEKPLDVNIFPKIPWSRFYYLHCLKIISVLIWPFAISKNTLCWLRLTRCWPQFKTHAALSLHLHSLPLSPIRNVSFSLSLCTLCLIPLYVLPVLIPHKKCMLFEYDYHWFTENICPRMHLLFHLALEYNKLCLASIFFNFVQKCVRIWIPGWAVSCGWMTCCRKERKSQHSWSRKRWPSKMINIHHPMLILILIDKCLFKMDYLSNILRCFSNGHFLNPRQLPSSATLCL